MAYVESFYLEPETCQAPLLIDNNAEAQKIESLQDLNEVNVSVREAPASDYCGFESDEIPPIYRAQLRAAQKSKILAAENADKSFYAYGEDVEKKKVDPVEMAMKNEESPHEKMTSSGRVEYYVPGFSPPPQNENDEVQKRNDFSLPKMLPIEATENVFNIAGKHELSQYVPMEHEDINVLNMKAPKNVAAPKGSKKTAELESLISYTASATSLISSSILGSSFGSTNNTSSCLTADLGPAFGCLPSGGSGEGPASPKDKYKGLSAFRPVTKSIASEYAAPELN